MKSTPEVANAKAEPAMKRPAATFGYKLSYWKLANKRSFQCAHYKKGKKHAADNGYSTADCSECASSAYGEASGLWVANNPA